MYLLKSEKRILIIGGAFIIVAILVYLKWDFILEKLFNIPKNKNCNEYKFSDIFVGILGGIITAYILFLRTYFLKHHENRKLRKLFGFNENFSLIVPEFKVREDLQNRNSFPLIHLKNGINVSSSGLFGYVDVKAANYISELVYNRLIGRSELVSDNKYCKEPNQNYSYIAFGSTNIFFKSIINEVVNVNTLPNFIDDIPEDGYGLIIKTKDASEIRIGIGGFSESGTSGAAFYFANYWKEIEKKFGKNGFAILVKVVEGDDSSADDVISINIDKDNKNIIDNFFRNNNVLKIIKNKKSTINCSTFCENINNQDINSKLGSFCNFINCKINICNSSFRCTINDDSIDPSGNPSNPENNDGSGPQGSPSTTDHSEDIENSGNPKPSDKHDDIGNSGEHGTSGHNTCAGISSSFHSNGKNETSENADSQY